jgi:hypothetical protein
MIEGRLVSREHMFGGVEDHFEVTRGWRADTPSDLYGGVNGSERRSSLCQTAL